MIINSFSGASNGRTISFENNTLTISNVTHADALAIVASLDDGPAAAPAAASTNEARPRAEVRPLAKTSAPEPESNEPDHAHGARRVGRVGPPMPRVDEAAIASAAATSTPKPKAEPKPRRAAPAAEDADAPEAEAAPAPRARRAAPESAPEPEPEPEPEEVEEDIPHAEAKSLPKSNGVNGHAKHATAADADVDPALVNAKKLKDVLAHLLDMGITDVDDLKKKCAELRPSVMVLQRITDLDSRIDRTLEVMNAGDEVS